MTQKTNFTKDQKPWGARRAAARIGRHSHVTCLDTGLVRYRDRRQAQDALASCRRSRQRAESIGLISTRNEQSVVRCSACSGGYHLSIRPATTVGGGEAA